MPPTLTTRQRVGLLANPSPATAASSAQAADHAGTQRALAGAGDPCLLHRQRQQRWCPTWRDRQGEVLYERRPAAGHAQRELLNVQQRTA